MKFQGTVAFAAAQTAVWHVLTTPNLVSQCTPRLQGWSALEADTQFQLTFNWGGPHNNIIIPLLLTWKTVTPPAYLQWHGEAKMGKTAVPIHGDFNLVKAGASQTSLTFSAQVKPPNKLLAQMIHSIAPRLIDSFFHCLKKTAEAV